MRNRPKFILLVQIWTYSPAPVGMFMRIVTFHLRIRHSRSQTILTDSVLVCLPHKSMVWLQKNTNKTHTYCHTLIGAFLSFEKLQSSFIVISWKRATNTLFKISPYVFHKRKQVIWVCNDMWMSLSFLGELFLQHAHLLSSHFLVNLLLPVAGCSLAVVFISPHLSSCSSQSVVVICRSVASVLVLSP